MASEGVVQPGIRGCTDLAARPTTMIPTCHAARYSQKSAWDMDGLTDRPAERWIDGLTGRRLRRLGSSVAALRVI